MREMMFPTSYLTNRGTIFVNWNESLFVPGRDLACSYLLIRACFKPPKGGGKSLGHDIESQSWRGAMERRPIAVCRYVFTIT
jgi:hypothetical protein